MFTWPELLGGADTGLARPPVGPCSPDQGQTRRGGRGWRPALSEPARRQGLSLALCGCHCLPRTRLRPAAPSCRVLGPLSVTSAELEKLY